MPTGAHLRARLDLAIAAVFLWTTLFMAGGALMASSASALGTILPGQYYLLDHPDGSAAPPPYGLRVDSLGLLFSTELGSAEVILDWDGGSTASIIGTLYDDFGNIWDVEYYLSGVVAEPGNLGFTATAATGTLTDPSLVVTALTGEADITGSVFTFLADGHRLGSWPAFGDGDTAVARGWLLPPGSTDDWLVRAVPVPEPGTALLFGLGIAALAGKGRREQR